jgi:hypothetical protein
MTEIEQLVPTRERIPLTELTHRIAARSPAFPFENAILERCAKFSRAIFDDGEAWRYPELQTLAFKMRKTALLQLCDAFAALRTDEAELVPRGIVFHIPPANVDTIFIYCWLFAELTGNVNVIRLPERAGPAAVILCRLMTVVSESTFIVRYGHDPEITGALSRIADVRVIWGGDATIDGIRQIPIPAHARELTFADRSSLSVIDSDRFGALMDKEQIELASKFFNDAFWFDQMACSSPRWIVWRGDESSTAKARLRFAEMLAREVNRRGYILAPAARLERYTFSCRAILEAPVSGCLELPELAILDVVSPGDLPRDHFGGGMFFQTRVNRLGELAPFLNRTHQTLTHFGIEAGELSELVRALRGRALDRMVPIGQALSFDRFWDGHDLLREFTRTVHVDCGAAV